MLDICDGAVRIPGSCSLGMSSNGTLLVFTDMTVQTAYTTYQFSFQREYYQMYNTLGIAHQLLSEKMLQAQVQAVKLVEQSLLNYFFGFLFGSMALFLFYGTPVVNIYLSKINDTKKMLSLLPLSLASESQEMQAYFQQIITRKKFCFN
jgi:hypothetical protein